MPSATFEDLIRLADAPNADAWLLESLSFACRAKNLTPATLKCYAERLMNLVRYARSIGTQLDQLTQRDIRNYLMSVIDEVSGETVNVPIRIFRVFNRHLMAEGLFESNPMDQVRLVRTAHKLKTVITTEEMNNALSHFNLARVESAQNSFIPYVVSTASWIRSIRLSGWSGFEPLPQARSGSC